MNTKYKQHTESIVMCISKQIMYVEKVQNVNILKMYNLKNDIHIYIGLISSVSIAPVQMHNWSNFKGYKFLTMYAREAPKEIS